MTVFARGVIHVPELRMYTSVNVLPVNSQGSERGVFVREELWEVFELCEIV
jgi:hypothetical protein